MPVFNYQARTPEGELQIGTVEAGSKEGAINVLQRHNLIVVELEAQTAIPFVFRKIDLFQRISRKEVAIFSRQLATLFEAKVPLLQSLKALGDQTTNPYFKGKVFEILSDVDSGEALSKAMARHPKVFSEFYINMVRSGEVSGRLQETLDYLADHLDREYYIVSRIRNSLIYPAFILFGFIAVGSVMFIFVVPQLVSVLEESGQELPFLTKVLIFVSNFLKTLGILILILSGIGIFILLQYLRTKEGRRVFDKTLLTLPIIKDIFSKIYISRFSENLGTLVLGGIPIAQALRVSANTIGNTIYQEVLKNAEEAVKRGETISSVLKDSPGFPPLVTQMVATGESTGRLDTILMNLAKFYQREVDSIIDNLLNIIEPVLITVLGIAVGILVAAILIPIYNMVGAL